MYGVDGTPEIKGALQEYGVGRHSREVLDTFHLLHVLSDILRLPKWDQSPCIIDTPTVEASQGGLSGGPAPQCPLGWGRHLTASLACTRDSLGVADLARPSGTGGQGQGPGIWGLQPAGEQGSGAAASLLDPASSFPNVVTS